MDVEPVGPELIENDDTCSTVSSSHSTHFDAYRDGDEEDSRRFEPRRPLEPFAHQVGGHFPMVCLDEDTVCKPINDRELRIYQTMPENLVPFVPKFHGVMKVDFKECDDGYITLTGLPPPGYHPKVKDDQDSKVAKLLLRPDLKPSPSSDDDGFCNPWALRCHRDHLKKLGLEDKGQTTKYLLLENVVNHYKRPCVLDLKVGKRQYSDDESAEKAKRKIAKSNQTTSRTLGLRLCGMQVFKDGKYQCLNKYDGRLLKDDNFKETIQMFLKPGLIPNLLTKLENLKAALLALDSFRFYTCSVLVTYDATKDDSIDVRMIDFAHSTHKGLSDPVVYEGPDEGFVEGISSLINILKNLRFGSPNARN